MVEVALPLNTALGTALIAARCASSTAADVSLRLDLIDVSPRLPPGMSVSGLRVVVLQVATAAVVPSLQWSCTLSGAGTGAGCNGEGLAAQEWQADGRLVTAGTEDYAYCAANLAWLPWLAPDEPDDFRTHAADRLALLFHAIPARATFGLHFAVAENPWPEPVHASSWYAVDVSRADIALYGRPTRPTTP